MANEPTVPFPVVGLGASAGGLEAFREFLSALSPDTGMAFVLLLHLPPDHQSQLAEILGRVCPIPLSEVREPVPIQPDHVYVLPGGSDLEMQGKSLALVPRHAAPGQHRPIDNFFQVLAQRQGRCAIGVVLSGTASDGTLGIQDIKASGGITFAQDDTAQQSGMPRSAIATGMVDRVLPAADIARELAYIAKNPLVSAAPDSETAPFELEPVLRAVRKAVGVDFTHYKPNTLYRRITRRMVLHKMDAIADYLRLLQSDPAEAKALYQDFLINVTSFFRNPEAYDALKNIVFPRLTENRSRHDPVRIWTLGCSTGEETYSIAIAYAEFLEAHRLSLPVQVFGTDLNEVSIERARLGVYSASALEHLDAERLRRFFVRIDGSYRIAKSVREACIFARHNVLTDPPFSRMDMVSCRNMLIYLGGEVQQKVMPIVHYALRPDGYLWLGNSETIGSYRDLFDTIDQKAKIYARKGPAERITLNPAPEERIRGTAFGTLARVPEPLPAVRDTQKEVDRLLLARYAPPSVLIRSDLEILQYRGNTAPYIAPAPGKASLNLLKMLREGLVLGVRSAVERCKTSEMPVRVDDLWITGDDVQRRVAVEVLPVRTGIDRAELFAVIFEDVSVAPGDPTPPGEREASAQQEDAKLKQELSATREYLQSVIEQQESANEELQSANEEVQSANEELQSINEELETSKEEIQSSNEELATVNDELHARNTELAQSNNDLVNLLASVQIPIVMLGPSGRIRRFTPSAEKVLNLIPTDVGRPMSDLKGKLDVPDIGELVRKAMDDMTGYEREVLDRDGRWHLLRIRPYRTLEHKIDGAVVSLVDIDSLKRNHEQLIEADRHKDEFLAMLGHELRNPLAPLRNVVAVLKSPKTIPADAERALGIMDRQIENMARLIDDLLDVSRITLSQIELRTELLDLCAVVRRVADQFDFSLRSRGQTLQVELPDKPVFVEADAVRLDQMIGNLLDNASKYSGKGGNIRIAVRHRTAGRAVGIVSVKDEGIGISADKLPHVFDLFMRATRSGGHNYGGLGVGLTLVKRLAELHGGKITAHSAGEGRGSEFMLQLPSADPAQRTPGPAGGVAVQAADVPVRRVLIVDDNVDNAESLAMFLRQGPHDVKVASDGAGAIEIARSFRPDLAVIDIGMPEMDGYEVARRLRALGNEALLLIALSGYGDEQARDRAWQAGFDEYLLKTADMEHILGRLQSCERRKPPR